MVVEKRIVISQRFFELTSAVYSESPRTTEMITGDEFFEIVDHYSGLHSDSSIYSSFFLNLKHHLSENDLIAPGSLSAATNVTRLFNFARQINATSEDVKEVLGLIGKK